MARRVDLPRTNLRERRRKRRILLGCLAVGAVVLVVAIAAGITWLPFLRISAIDVHGQKTVMPQAVQQTTQNELYGGYLHLFARSNIFLYPKNTIRQTLLEQFPMFQSVDVHVENFHTIGVSIVERQPVALWCGPNVATSSSCFLVDQGGIVYAPAVVYSGDAYKKFYGSVVGAALPQQFLTPSQFHSLATLVDALQQKVGSSVQSIAVDDEHDVRVTFSSGFALIFVLDVDSGDMFERFGLALNSNPFKTHMLTDFQYLDLRFGDRLYYKLKSAITVKPATATSTATSSVHA